MTSFERVIRTIQGLPTDYIAVMPYMYDVASEIARVPLIDFYTDPKAMVKAQMYLYERLHQDVITIGSDNFYIAEGFGCRTTRNTDELPALVRPAVECFNHLYDLEIPDPETDGRMPLMLEAIRRVRENVGNQVAIRSPGTGPFALASYLLGTERWLMEIAMIEAGMSEANEPAVRHALELSTEALIRFGIACHDAGADIIHCGDSLASCDVISPSTFRNFSFPYCQRVFTAWKDHGVTCKLLHICGNSTKVLLDYVKTGADLIEIDAKVDLGFVVETIGNQTAIAGNIDTVDILLKGNPASVRSAAKDCIQKTKGSRFILGSGCLVPRKTPLENLKMLVKAAREQRRQ
jgi:uroporphyrinogen decarboxylase